MSWTAPARAWAAGLLPGARSRRLQVAAYAAEWEDANRAALASEGPLWVVLGDSTAQAIGASSREHGYVYGTLRRLREERDPRWRLINLSRTGATVMDVVTEQLPRLGDLPAPDLLSCAAGANDLLRTPAHRFEAELSLLLDAVPQGALIATLPQGLRAQRTVAANTVIRARAAVRDLVVVDVWGHTGPPWSGRFSADMFHPNDLGYASWTAAFCAALELAL